ncbi:MAG: AbrB/MazE/SpoVT family DNA-binding domain-containing protein [Syntrophomonadaceae bacterium]|jgi:antitoxin MazE|nr:AbrB/MazE/SpoVT family DNA-binding domain-containing protein [Syntrophomonadaceae bacterium]
MEAKVSKWGNSLGIRIPQWIAEQADISDGSIIEIDFKDKAILIKKKELSLEEMLNSITPENQHKEASTGSKVGGEAW